MLKSLLFTDSVLMPLRIAFIIMILDTDGEQFRSCDFGTFFEEQTTLNLSDFDAFVIGELNMCELKFGSVVNKSSCSLPPGGIKHEFEFQHSSSNFNQGQDPSIHQQKSFYSNFIKYGIWSENNVCSANRSLCLTE